MSSQSKPPKILRVVYGIEDGLLVGTLSIIILLSFTQILLRNLAHTGLPWADALLRYLVLWIGLLGAMVATREDNHITVDIIPHYVSPRARVVLRIFTDAFAGTVCFLLTYSSLFFLRDEKAGADLAFGSIPTWIAELILPVAFGAIGLRFLVFFGLHIWQAVKGVPPESVEGHSS